MQHHQGTTRMTEKLRSVGPMTKFLEHISRICYASKETPFGSPDGPVAYSISSYLSSNLCIDTSNVATEDA